MNYLCMGIFTRARLIEYGGRMKVQEIMTNNPASCNPNERTNAIAQLMCELNVGSIPVVDERLILIGMITDRDLCCSVVAKSLDAKATTVGEVATRNPIACREEDDLETCERLMQQYQVRRIPIVDAENRLIGIVSQADLARNDQPERVYETLAEISKSKAAGLDDRVA